MAVLTSTQRLMNFISRLFFFWLPSDRRPFSTSSLSSTSSSSSSSSSSVEPSRGTGLKALKYLLPLFWPKDWSLRIVLFLSVGCMIADRLFKLFVPIIYGSAIQSLSNGKFPLTEMLLYFFLSVGSSSVSDVQDTIFQRMIQHVTRTISLRTYSHLHRLSLRWHLNRNTGATLRVIDRGISSASSVIDLVCFEFFPTLLDFALVCFVLFYKYGGIYSVLVLLTLASYVALTLSITEWRTKFRRQTNESENELNQLTVDALLNFETVKYFTAEKHETKRYSEAQQKMFENQKLGRMSLTFLNFVQNLIKAISFSTAMILAGYRLVQPGSTTDIGDVVTILTYITQVFRPLNWLGTSYRQINQNFVDMEKLFELMEQPLEIKDVPKAQALKVKEGRVTFEDVCFSYDGKSPTINNLNFTIQPGQTVAIVGPSGAGKSTVARLLLRFYSVSSGRVLIDGQDISKVTQVSLRENVGIVPQDTVLFNDTILYNIGYGKREAPEQQVEEAARQARIHDFIMSSKAPNHYQTKVGERGLRLSGGEKQRVAIARAILKDPPILILDEATSSLDSHTEKEIQTSLLEITRGRTALVIAHRLSTVVKAHQILVLKDGVIIEQGTHSQLLSLGGEYASLWLQQSNVDVHEDINEFSPKFPPPVESSQLLNTRSLPLESKLEIDEEKGSEEEEVEGKGKVQNSGSSGSSSFFNPFDLLTTKKKKEDFEEIELTTIPKLEPPPSNSTTTQTTRGSVDNEKKDVVIDIGPLLSGNQGNI